MSRDPIVGKREPSLARAMVYGALYRFFEAGTVYKTVAEDGRQNFAVWTDRKGRRLTGGHSHCRCTNPPAMECLQAPVNHAVPPGGRAGRSTVRSAARVRRVVHGDGVLLRLPMTPAHTSW